MAGLSPVLMYKLSDNVLTHITVTDDGWFERDKAGNLIKLEGDRLEKVAMYVANNKISPERIIPAGHHLMPDGTVMADEAHTPPRGVSEQLAAKVGPPSGDTLTSPKSFHKKGSLSYYTEAERRRNELIALKNEAYQRLKAKTDAYHAAQPTTPPGSPGGAIGGAGLPVDPAAWSEAARYSPLLREEYDAFSRAKADVDSFDAAHPDVLQMINPGGGYPAEFEGRLSDADAHYRRAQWEQSKAEQ